MEALISVSTDAKTGVVQSSRTTSLSGKVPTCFPAGPGGPRAPGGPIRVRLLMGQPWEHLAWMEAAYWESWAVITPLQSFRTCSSVRAGPWRTQRPRLNLQPPASTFTSRNKRSGFQNSVFPFHLPVILAPEAFLRLHSQL